MGVSLGSSLQAGKADGGGRARGSRDVDEPGSRRVRGEGMALGGRTSRHNSGGGGGDYGSEEDIERSGGARSGNGLHRPGNQWHGPDIRERGGGREGTEDSTDPPASERKTRRPPGDMWQWTKQAEISEPEIGEGAEEPSAGGRKRTGNLWEGRSQERARSGIVNTGGLRQPGDMWEGPSPGGSERGTPSGRRRPGDVWKGADAIGGAAYSDSRGGGRKPSDGDERGRGVRDGPKRPGDMWQRPGSEEGDGAAGQHGSGDIWQGSKRGSAEDDGTGSSQSRAAASDLDSAPYLPFDGGWRRAPPMPPASPPPEPGDAGGSIDWGNSDAKPSMRGKATAYEEPFRPHSGLNDFGRGGGGGGRSKGDGRQPTGGGADDFMGPGEGAGGGERGGFDKAGPGSKDFGGEGGGSGRGFGGYSGRDLPGMRRHGDADGLDGGWMHHGSGRAAMEPAGGGGGMGGDFRHGGGDGSDALGGEGSGRRDQPREFPVSIMHIKVKSAAAVVGIVIIYKTGSSCKFRRFCRR
jgi:hypothetical protein